MSNCVRYRHGGGTGTAAAPVTCSPAPSARPDSQASSRSACPARPGPVGPRGPGRPGAVRPAVRDEVAGGHVRAVRERTGHPRQLGGHEHGGPLVRLVTGAQIDVMKLQLRQAQPEDPPGREVLAAPLHRGRPGRLGQQAAASANRAALCRRSAVSSAALRPAPASIAASRAASLGYIGDFVPVRAQCSRLRRPSAFRARWVSTCPRVQPGSRDGRRPARRSAGWPRRAAGRWIPSDPGQLLRGFAVHGPPFGWVRGHPLPRDGTLEEPGAGG